MIKRDNIQSEIEYFEKELRNLKVPQGVVRNVDSFYYKHLDPTAKVKIKYGQTDNVPITTLRAVGGEFVSAVLSRYDKANKEQYVYFNTDSSYILPNSLLIFSTAPIERVENIR